MYLKFNSKFKYQKFYLASVGLVSFNPPFILPRLPSLFDWTLILTLGLDAPLCLLKPLQSARRMFTSHVGYWQTSLQNAYHGPAVFKLGAPASMSPPTLSG